MWIVIEPLLLILILVIVISQIMLPILVPSIEFFWFFRRKQALPPLNQMTEDALNRARKAHDELVETKERVETEIADKTLLKTKLEEYERNK